MLERRNTPEWIRINDATEMFGLTRPHLFRLIAEGKIKSRHLMRDGAAKGIRLIEVQSLRDYIEESKS